MSSFIEHIEINNFKSIRHLELDGFRRINLFIGKPNVGKSNILEALSMFTIPLLKNYHSLKLNDLIRAESMLEIFYEGNFQDSCKILARDSEFYYQSTIAYLNDPYGDKLKFENYFSKDKTDLGLINNFYLNFDENFERDSPMGGGKGGLISHIRRYIFKKGVVPESKGSSFLFPPFGPNLLHVLEYLPSLRQTIASWFEKYGLKLVLDRTNNVVKVQKGIGRNEIYTLPYSSIADTLQRIIFYKTSIASNEDSVLIFEEPEAHAYPPYIAEFTQDVIHSETNQFFMATHSPIIVNEFLENAIDDL